MAFIGFLAVVLILFLLFRLYIYNLESEERKKKYEKKPIKINEESHVQFHYFDEEDNCIEDYEEYTNRMQERRGREQQLRPYRLKEIWGYDPYNVEPIESYCEKAIHIE